MSYLNHLYIWGSSDKKHEPVTKFLGRWEERVVVVVPTKAEILRHRRSSRSSLLLFLPDFCLFSLLQFCSSLLWLVRVGDCAGGEVRSNSCCDHNKRSVVVVRPPQPQRSLSLYKTFWCCSGSNRVNLFNCSNSTSRLNCLKIGISNSGLFFVLFSIQKIRILTQEEGKENRGKQAHSNISPKRAGHCC